jgi:hypothetical protein
MRKGIKMENSLNQSNKNIGKKIKNTDTIVSTNKRGKISKSIDTDDACDDEEQLMKKSNTVYKRERVKSTCTVSARMRQVVDNMVLCSEEQYNADIQQTTIFAFKSLQSEIVSCFLEELRRENAPLMQNKVALMQLIDEAYERSQSLIMLHTAK